MNRNEVFSSSPPPSPVGIETPSPSPPPPLFSPFLGCFKPVGGGWEGGKGGRGGRFLEMDGDEVKSRQQRYHAKDGDERGGKGLKFLKGKSKNYVLEKFLRPF